MWRLQETQLAPLAGDLAGTQPHSRCPSLSLSLGGRRKLWWRGLGACRAGNAAGFLHEGELASQSETEASWGASYSLVPLPGRVTGSRQAPCVLPGGSRAPGRQPWACESVSQPGTRPRVRVQPAAWDSPRALLTSSQKSAYPASFHVSRGPAGTRCSPQSPSLRFSERQQSSDARNCYLDFIVLSRSLDTTTAWSHPEMETP